MEKKSDSVSCRLLVLVPLSHLQCSADKSDCSLSCFSYFSWMLSFCSLQCHCMYPAVYFWIYVVTHCQYNLSPGRYGPGCRRVRAKLAKIPLASLVKLKWHVPRAGEGREEERINWEGDCSIFPIIPPWDWKALNQGWETITFLWLVNVKSQNSSASTGHGSPPLL